MIGVVVDNVINNPQNYVLFRELNKLAQDEDCYLFTNTVQALPMNHNFAILQQVEALKHSGILIGTSMLNAQIVANCLTASKKYFYVWSPEWMNLQKFGSQQLRKMFYNDDVDLLARSTCHWNLLAKMFKEPNGIVYNWNAEQLRSVICQNSSS